MNGNAKVTKVTRVTKHDAAHTELDIVNLTYDGKLYVWESAPGTYATGQEVAVNPPTSQGYNITLNGDQ